MALGSTTQNLVQGTEYHGWEFNPRPLGTRPHVKARFTHLRVWFSACCPQQIETEAASTSSSTDDILEPPGHFCPPGMPMLNCVSCYSSWVSRLCATNFSSFHLHPVLRRVMGGLCHRSAEMGYGQMVTRPCGWKQYVHPNHLHPLLHSRAFAKLY